MYRKVSIKIILILVTAAILTVPSSMLQISHAQSTKALQDVLTIHNRERGAVGNSALTWSNSLASQAQGYADQLSSQGYVCNGSNGNLDVCRTAEPYKYLPHGASNENSARGGISVIQSTRWSRDRSIAGSQKSLIITPKPIRVQGCAVITQR